MVSTTNDDSDPGRTDQPSAAPEPPLAVPEQHRASRLTRIPATVLVALGAIAGAMAWLLPATDGGLVDDVPPVSGLLHSVLPLIGFAICAGAAWRIGAGWSAGGLGTVRLLLDAMGLAIVVQATRLGPFVPATFLLVFNCSMALACSLLLLRIDQQVPRAVRVTADLVVGISLFLLAGAEAGLRLMAWQAPRPDFVQRDELPESRLAKLRRSAGVPRFGVPLAEGGFLGEFTQLPQTAAGPRVLLLGDESLQGHVPAPFSPAAAAAEHWPAARFVDRGVPGSGPREQRVLLEQILAAGSESDAPSFRAAIVCLDVTDDLGDMGRELRSWRRLSMLVDRDNLLLTVLLDRFRTRQSEGPSPADPDQWPWPLKAATEAWQKSTEPAPTAAQLLEQLKWLDDPALEQPVLPTATLDRRLRERVLDAYGPGASGRLRRTVETLAEMQTVCEAHGMRLGVFLLPSCDQLDPELGRQVAGLRPDGATGVAIQQHLAQSLSAYGIPVSDPLPQLNPARADVSDRGRLFHRGGTELNRRGCKLVGELLAEFAKQLASEPPK